MASQLTASKIACCLTSLLRSSRQSLRAKFMGPTWGPSGASRTQVGPMLAHELNYLGCYIVMKYWVYVIQSVMIIIVYYLTTSWGFYIHSENMWPYYRKLIRITINSSPPSAAYTLRWIGSALVQVMAWHRIGAKPLPEPMLTYCQLDPYQQTSVKFESEYKTFHSRICIWKYRLRNGSHFCPGEMN